MLQNCIFAAQLNPMKRKINWDAVGVMTSIVCAIHCAILPLVLTTLPILGMNLIDNDVFEFAMIGIAFIVGVIALYKGKNVHRNTTPIALFSLGIFFLVLKEIFHQWHIYLLIPAVFFILLAHYKNVKMLHFNVASRTKPS